MYKRKTREELSKELEQIDKELIEMPKLFNPKFEQLLERRRCIERLV